MEIEPDLWVVTSLHGISFSNLEFLEDNNYGFYEAWSDRYGVNVSKITRDHFSCEDCIIKEIITTMYHEILHGVIFFAGELEEGSINIGEEKVVRGITGEVWNDFLNEVYRMPSIFMDEDNNQVLIECQIETILEEGLLKTESKINFGKQIVYVLEQQSLPSQILSQ